MKKITLSIKQRYRGQSLAFTALFIVLVILLNTLAGILTAKLNLSFDMTAGGIYQLSAPTQEMLRTLPGDVTITVLADKQDFETVKGYAEVNEILLRYQSGSMGRIALRYVNVHKNPTFLAQYGDLSGLREGAVIIENSKRHKAYQISELYELETDNTTGQVSITSISAEQKLTSGILFVNLDVLPQAEFIIGHNESFPSELENIFLQNNFALKTTNLIKEDFDEQTKLVVLSAPQVDFGPDEIKKLDRYLEGGRDFIVFYDAQGKELPVLERFAAEWGIEFSKNIVVDPSRSVGSLDFVSPLIIKSEITARLEKSNNTILLLQTPFYITPLWESAGYRTVTPLLRTSDQSYSKTFVQNEPQSLEKSGSDPVGSYCLGVLCEEKWVSDNRNLHSRVLFFSSASLIQDELMLTQNLMNRSFVYATVSYLSRQTDLVEIPPRNLQAGKLLLTGSAATLIFWLVVVLLPLTILGAGFVKWNKRRNM